MRFVSSLAVFRPAYFLHPQTSEKGYVKNSAAVVFQGSIGDDMTGKKGNVHPFGPSRYEREKFSLPSFS